MEVESQGPRVGQTSLPPSSM